jgi:hypothetical protein
MLRRVLSSSRYIVFIPVLGTFIASLALLLYEAVVVITAVIDAAWQRSASPKSRHVLAELDRLGLPRLKTTISEAVAYGEMSFSGALPESGPAVEEIAALMAE